MTVSGGTVTARVLAGTVPRGADADADAAASFALAHSAKDLDEHRYAVQSVLDALAPAHERPRRRRAAVHARSCRTSGTSRPTSRASWPDHASALDLVASLHPTAAVAGTPTDAAIELIRRLEPFDRGRYAGPVGWVDANGDGEWAIALRCAQIGASLGAVPPRTPRHASRCVAHAGAGIVAGSDPETELLETRVKFRPIVDALA